MSVEELKSELKALSLDDRRQMTAFLVSLRHKELTGYREALSEKIDDPKSEHWVSFEEFDRRISA